MQLVATPESIHHGAHVKIVQKTDLRRICAVSALNPNDSSAHVERAATRRDQKSGLRPERRALDSTWSTPRRADTTGCRRIDDLLVIRYRQMYVREIDLSTGQTTAVVRPVETENL
jgi:hypothetical protein